MARSGYPQARSARTLVLEWDGPSGVGSDIFSRVGSFPGRDCARTRADVHVHVAGRGTVLDNTWMWHADHDACPKSSGTVRSDESLDHNGLVVNAPNAIVYGLKVEHMFGDHVLWRGERGQVFFYQCELLYHRPDFAASGKVGYRMDNEVRAHHGVALGVYMVYHQIQNVTAFAAPQSAHFENLMGWCLSSNNCKQLKHLLCHNYYSRGNRCLQGDCTEESNVCRLKVPPIGPARETTSITTTTTSTTARDMSRQGGHVAVIATLSSLAALLGVAATVGGFWYRRRMRTREIEKSHEKPLCSGDVENAMSNEVLKPYYQATSAKEMAKPC